MKVTVQVTEENILRGLRGSWCECPIAMALRPHVKREFMICVSSRGAFLKRWSELYVLLIEPKISKFVIDFDDYKHVEPFQFDADIPENAYQGASNVQDNVSH